ncbi:hypothetical protein VII00023_06562 [Vibrio ichthyoenteri ATCC 700023]|uniref:Uncharacterized protein n=1 Tax=Vibrio ichthyoenteri ATCC 700023 TaxID=870968 RepID=F9S6M4_9VIBR|nr:hypothetical protein VII00023_06562 [Vibrio ichthyoenteri ATCC 700023]
MPRQFEPFWLLIHLTDKHDTVTLTSEPPVVLIRALGALNRRDNEKMKFLVIFSNG